MHVPGLMERVRLVEAGEVYLVTRVDPEAEVADLLPILYGKQELYDVPFAVIEVIPGCRPPKVMRG